MITSTSGYPPPTEYVFIDGGYLRRQYCDAMITLFNEEGELDFLKVASGHKIFYYDCLDDVQKSNESQEEFNARETAQHNFFDSIRSLNRFHVRLGTISGQNKRLRQKQVDVRLAVDMLTHAFHRNMQRAVLIAGDLDFKPAVEALVDLGVTVQVKYVKGHASPDLYWSADERYAIPLADLHGWSSDKFLIDHPVTSFCNDRPDRNGNVIKRGTACGDVVELFQYQPPQLSAPVRYSISWARSGRGWITGTSYRDFAALCKIFEDQYETKIEWQDGN